MTFRLASLYQWPRHSTPKAREIVLNIINSSKTPLATKDIYKLAVSPVARQEAAKNTTDDQIIIRSMRHLKTVVIRDLAAHNRIEKVMTRGAFTAWLWRPKQAPSTPASQNLKPNTSLLSAVSGSTALTPAAVGVGEDWSHLNKRRQRARNMKVQRDLQWMLGAQKARGGSELQTSAMKNV